MSWALEFAQNVKFPVFRIGQEDVVDGKLLIVTARSDEDLVLLDRCLGEDL